MSTPDESQRHGAQSSALSYTEGLEDLALLDQTIGENLRRMAREYPDADAVLEAGTGRFWSFARLLEDVDTVSLALIAAGFAKGDRVGLWAPNCAEWTLVQYGAAQVGVILVNLNPAYRSHELSFVVQQCGMRALIVAPPDARSDAPAVAREVAGHCPDLETLIMLPLPGEVNDASYPHANPGRTARAGDGLHHHQKHFVERTWSAVMEDSVQVTEAQLAQRAQSLRPTDPINLQYTSGTTGFPKGVTLTHFNLLNNGFHIGELLGYTVEDSVVLPVPFFHCFGMVIGNLAALSHGAATIIPSRGFEPAAALAAVQEYGATSLYGVPTMFIAELALPNFDDYNLSTLRTGVMAGSPCPVEVMRTVINRMHMGEVAICYGMTETSPVSTMTRAKDSIEQRTRTVGRTMPALESKVVDPGTGEILPRGRTGELCTRGYSVMAGYWAEPEQTAAAVDEDGWMHTGDLASMDTDGYISIDGRIKDLIIRGGENVSPREVEEFLYTHPQIQDVQVIGVPDEKYGEELMACIVLVEGAESLTPADIREFAAGSMAHYKIPRYVQILERFPMTVSGKVRKVQMRQDAARFLSEGGS